MTFHSPDCWIWVTLLALLVLDINKGGWSLILLFRILFLFALAAISYLALAPLNAVSVTSGWDKLNHLLAFAVLLSLLDWAYPAVRIWPFKLLALFAYGFAIEFAQAFIPYREFSLLDLLADALGLGIYLICRPALLPYRSMLSGGGVPR